MKTFAVSFGTVMLFVLGGSEDHFNDPEPDVTWTPPLQEEKLQIFGYGARYSGRLFAGTIQFNWIVDIRSQDEDQEAWAIGSAVSHKHVLTTCRGVQVMLSHASDKGEQILPDEEYEWSEYKYTARMKVHYCRHYLGRKDKTSGGRYVDKVVRHPSCRRSEMAFDAAFLVVIGSIPALGPDVGYMPIGFNYRLDKTIEVISLNPSEKITFKSPVCYVATYGKDYYNQKEFYVYDFKIKFRVYVTPWKDCKETWGYVCNETLNEHCRSPVEKDSGGGYLLCFRPRAKVGTVCDHDRGAPLVCDGLVVGMVVQGVKFQHCNSLYKMPFIVERVDHYRQFVEKSLDFVVRPVPRNADAAITNAPPDEMVPFSAAPLFVLSPLFMASSWTLTLGPN